MQVLQIQELKLDIIQKNTKTPLVKSISFSLSEGKTTALVGESGSGKSLTALSILRLLPKKMECGGSILFHSQGKKIELTTASDGELQKIRGKEIAMIFQEPMSALNPLIRCGDQISESMIRHLRISAKEARVRTLDLIKKVELDDAEVIFERYPHQLSGGQQQRIMIAMAISCEPRILIADEPTTALDVQVQEQILKLIRKLQVETKMAVLLITHDIGLVEQYADEVMVMYKGEMMEQGTSNQILHHSNHPYTKGLLACRPLFSYKGKRLPVLEDFFPGIPSEDSNKKSAIIGHSTFSPDIEEKKILEVYDASFGYGQTSGLFIKKSEISHTVSEVSFDVRKGEMMGLVGESGSGKSTMGKAILRLLPILKGSITLHGKDINQYNRKEFARLIQVVFQDPYGSLNPGMKVGDAILEPMRIHGLFDSDKNRKEKTVDLLEMVGLRADDAQKYPHEFSGGQRQRICISRALSLNPSFLIFDESVSALDVSIQSQILNLIMELRIKLGFSGLFISHNLNVIHYISDRILVMQKGKIIEQGITAQVLLNPVQEYTRKLVSASV